MINLGSSSLKFNLFKIINKNLSSICSGICENIGNSHSTIKYNYNEKNFIQEIFLQNHKEAFKYIKKILCREKKSPIKNFDEIYALTNVPVSNDGMSIETVIGMSSKMSTVYPYT